MKEGKQDLKALVVPVAITQKKLWASVMTCNQVHLVELVEVLFGSLLQTQSNLMALKLLLMENGDVLILTTKLVQEVAVEVQSKFKHRTLKETVYFR
jgi:hypothetical protein